MCIWIFIRARNIQQKKVCKKLQTLQKENTFEKKWSKYHLISDILSLFVHSGRSPSKLTLDYLMKEKGISHNNGHLRIPLNSPDSVNVPGAAAGWFDTVKYFGNGKVL